MLCTLAGLASGCQLVGGYEPFDRANADVAVAHACDPLPDSKVDEKDLVTLLLVKAPEDRCFWIDKTEVTVSQYERFVKAVGTDPEWDPPRCSWKGAPSDPSHQPSDECAASAGELDSTPFAPERPIRCVDWCDAWQFCRWAGKDLCTTGGLGGTVDPMNAPDDWGTACGRHEQPYGEEYQHLLCNVGLQSSECFIKMKSKCTATVVGAFASCQYAGGPLDMIGNVAEWSRTCANFGTGGAELCTTRGGSYADDKDSAACSVRYAFQRRDARRPELGFRCCAPLTLSEQGQLGE